MLIAIDYDDTYTADPFLWDTFIDHAIGVRGHTVIMATQRVDPYLEEPRKVCAGLGITLVASSQPKREACAAEGYSPDVWIDDFPEGIFSERIYRG